MNILTFLSLLGALIDPAIVVAKICDFSRIVPHEGSEVLQIPENIRGFLREGDRVFFLGSGDFDGASVYRVISQDGKERVLKYFRNPRSLYFELERFEAIEEALRFVPEAQRAEAFRVSSYRRALSAQVLEMESVRGREVSNIRRIERRDPLPAAILRRYRAQWEVLIQALRSRRLLVEDSLRKGEMVAEVINPLTGRRVMIDLHAGNVIVDPSTGAMTIIDPF